MKPFVLSTTRPKMSGSWPCCDHFEILAFYKVSLYIGESRGLVVKGEDSQLSGCGFETRRRILDGVSEACYYNGKRELKVAIWGTLKKYLKKVSLYTTHRHLAWLPGCFDNSLWLFSHTKIHTICV
jgi:hypothetical protein